MGVTRWRGGLGGSRSPVLVRKGGGHEQCITLRPKLQLQPALGAGACSGYAQRQAADNQPAQLA